MKRSGVSLAAILLLAWAMFWSHGAYAAGLLDAPGSFEGIVQGPDGKAVAGALVAAIPVGGERPAGTVLSQPGGRFKLEGLTPGKYGLTVTATGLTAAYAGGLAVTAGQAVRDLTIRLGGDGFTVSGTVKDTDGKPLAKAVLLASRYSNEDADLFEAVSDGQGAYTLTLPLARYGLAAESEGFEAEAKSVSKPENQVIDFRLLSKAQTFAAAPAQVTAWIRANAVPLVTCEAGHGFEDMQSLKKIVGDAHVVALGEATHGTREFFQFKHRMLEFLVTDMGFTVFGIEASFPESLAVNDYVLNGKGDPAKALAGMYFWTWDTEEVLKMIRWMRKYNEDPAHIHKVKFYGFDMQATQVAVPRVLAYVHKVDPANDAAARASLAPLKSQSASAAYMKLPQEKRKATAAQIEALLQRWDEHRAEYISRSSASEWALMRQHLRVIQQNEASLEAYAAGRGNLRDRFMAENIQWILNHEGPGTKAVIWAHNGHVSFDGEGYSYAPMGSYLKKALGKDLLVMGFAYDQGSFQAIESNPSSHSRGLVPFTVGPAPPGTLNGALASAGLPLFVLDIRQLPVDGEVGPWWRKPHKERSVGAIYSEANDDNFWARLVPANNYDAIFFVEKTTSARPNPSGKRSGAPGSGLKPAAAPSNLTFESGQAGQSPPEWHTTSGDCKAELSGDTPYEGKQCAAFTLEGGSFGTLMQQFDATPYRGKRVRFQAAVRANISGEGNWAGLWMRVDRNGGQMGFFDNMEDRPITDAAWKVYQVEGDVAPDAEALNIGLLVVGGGKAWIDAASVEVVGAATPPRP